MRTTHMPGLAARVRELQETIRRTRLGIGRCEAARRCHGLARFVEQTAINLLELAIAQQRGVRYYCARNEAAAPIMAEAFARLPGKLGVVSVTSGPGATNAVAGLAEAWVDSGPILILFRKRTDHIPGDENASGADTGAAGAAKGAV